MKLNMKIFSYLLMGGSLWVLSIGCSQAPAPESSSKDSRTEEVTASEESSKTDAGEMKEESSETASETDGKTTDNPTAEVLPAEKIAAAPEQGEEKITREVNQWGGSSFRNNTPVGKNIPTEWSPGEFDDATGEWNSDSAEGISWVSRLGSQTYAGPVVAGGRVYMGTNNGGGYLSRYAHTTDLGCLLCFNEGDGKFLWQHSSEKLPTGRVHDWPLQGICSAPYVEGDRLWFVTSRGEIACLDAEGFHDGENDGPFQSEPNDNKDEADAIWYVDLMAPPYSISQHNMCSCSITATGDILWVCTSNGLDESHINLPAPNAPSFMAVDKNSGKVLWTDNSPGENILHGQWSSPAFGVLGGKPQVIFAGGDSWLYSFLGEATPDGKAQLLWKFDANPKETKYILGGSGTRNEIIGTPVIHDGLVYVAVGQDPEHGEGVGHLWCIDPTKSGDVSSHLAFKLPDLEHPIPHTRRLQAVNPEEGEVARPNPNSAVVWHYSEFDQNGDGEVEFEETMHRTIGSVAIKNDLLYIADFSGLFHCVDLKTGKPHWTHDLFAACWGSPLIVEDKVYIGDEEGKVTVFRLSAEKEVISEIQMGNSIYTTPVVANNILYIANKTHLFAIPAKKDEGDADVSQEAEAKEEAKSKEE